MMDSYSVARPALEHFDGPRDLTTQQLFLLRVRRNRFLEFDPYNIIIILTGKNSLTICQDEHFSPKYTTEWLVYDIRFTMSQFCDAL